MHSSSLSPSGNELLHNLTSIGPVSLRVDMRSGNDTAYAHYANFSIDSEEKYYTLTVSGYTGTAGANFENWIKADLNMQRKRNNSDLNVIVFLCQVTLWGTIMVARSQLGTRTLILWGSTAPRPTWEAGGTRTATRPTSMVFMAQTVIIRYD